FRHSKVLCKFFSSAHLIGPRTSAVYDPLLLIARVSVMCLAMTVRATCNHVFNGVWSSLCEWLPVVHLQKELISRSLFERARPSAKAAGTRGLLKHVRSVIGVSAATLCYGRHSARCVLLFPECASRDQEVSGR